MRMLKKDFIGDDSLRGDEGTGKSAQSTEEKGVV